jgi:hypothetical protein
MQAGKLTQAARDASFAAIKSRLGAAQLQASGAVLGKLVDAWLDDLEAILGSIKDAQIDPRFVEGVLVEVKRQ